MEGTGAYYCSDDIVAFCIENPGVQHADFEYGRPLECVAIICSFFVLILCELCVNFTKRESN